MKINFVIKRVNTGFFLKITIEYGYNIKFLEIL